MKKTIKLLLVGLLLLSLVACGKSEENKPDETGTGNDQTEDVNEPEDPRELSDEQLIAQVKAELVGEWYCPIVELEHLTVNEDGTGHYVGLDKDVTFTYSIRVERLERENNGRLIDDIMKIDYDNGETEEVIFLIGDEEIVGNPGKTKMLFNTLDHGGYSGVMNFFDPWVKKTDAE